MKTRHTLQSLALRYLEGGPMRRRADAATLLEMAPDLSEESARIYLERFVAKWGLLEGESRPSAMIRRRPMSELEERVVAALTTDPDPQAPEPHAPLAPSTPGA